MILGISGKAGSGKDLVGIMIQYLTNSNKNKSYQGFLNYCYSSKPVDTNFKIVKFADKLKDIVCLILGCTREQLEDREFKEKELGDEWGGYQVSWNCPPNEWEGFFKTKEEAFEYLLKNGLEEDETIKNAFEEELIREIKLTPRLMLRILGTDCGRNMLHPNIWVNSTMSDYKPSHTINGVAEYMSNGKYRIIGHGELDGLILNGGPNFKYETEEAKYPNWIITDVRFENEVNVIKEKGGKVIRINRETEQINNHPSETSLDNYDKFDYVINNNGTIMDLFSNVFEILMKEELI